MKAIHGDILWTLAPGNASGFTYDIELGYSVGPTSQTAWDALVGVLSPQNRLGSI
jgi:hypothetical protein